MKRPQGFDRHAGSSTGATPGGPAPASPKATPVRKPAPLVPAIPPASSASTAAPSSSPSSSPASAPASARPGRAGKSRPPRSTTSAGEQRPDAAARRELRRAAKARRKYERGEVRRFTRRSRRRRVAWLVSGISLLLMVGFVTAAVYSPLLSLKTIKIEGATRVDAASVRAAVDGQIGTPLALVDFDTIKRSLARFPLIRSFVTETVPPDTLIIRIAERAPIATLATSSGFSVVDPAGVVILSGAERAPGLPLIELGSASKDSPAFTAAVGVLLALPADLLKRVDTVTAQTGDDVTLGLTGGTTVVWGSPEQSPLKARALAAAVGAPDSAGATTFDVSAPTHVVFTKG
jgi:cell division protein FtsQ